MRLSRLQPTLRLGLRLLATSFVLLALLGAALGLAPRSALAKGNYRIDDQAELLTEAQREQLATICEEISQYIDTGFISTTTAFRDVEMLADTYVEQYFGSDAAAVFAIDMYNRQIAVYANAEGKKIIREIDARAITDNVYTYASDGDYFGCAQAAFSQMLTRCQGGEVASPMRHVTNLLMAIVLGVLLNFLRVYWSRARIMRQRASSADMRSMAKMPQVLDTRLDLVNRVRHYHRSRSGGGGGGRGGGGGGGGGGASHRF